MFNNLEETIFEPFKEVFYQGAKSRNKEDINGVQRSWHGSCFDVSMR